MSGGHHGCVRVGCASGCGRGRGRKGVGRAETVAQRHSQAKDNAVCVRVGGRGECVVCGLCERGANGLRVCVRVIGQGFLSRSRVRYLARVRPYGGSAAYRIHPKYRASTGRLRRPRRPCGDVRKSRSISVSTGVFPRRRNI